MIITRSKISKAGTAIVVLVSILSCIHMFSRKCPVFFKPRKADLATRYDDRFSKVREALPARSVVRYVIDKPTTPSTAYSTFEDESFQKQLLKFLRTGSSDQSISFDSAIFKTEKYFELDHFIRFRLTQHAVAPAILITRMSKLIQGYNWHGLDYEKVPQDSTEYVISDYQNPALRDRDVELENYRIVRKFGNGIILYKKATQ